MPDENGNITVWDVADLAYRSIPRHPLIWCCSICGAAVWDTIAHEEWHARFDGRERG